METNQLYPVFLKMDQFEILIVGGGAVALEKLSFMLKSSPNARVSVLSKDFDTALTDLAAKHKVPLLRESYTPPALKGKKLVIAATDHPKVNQQIYQDAQARNILVNVADTPDFCDFYLGGIVSKGQVKIAISTNGKSPTLAKRLRQFLEELLPENINDLAENLHRVRKNIQGDFKEKVDRLNQLTQGMLINKP